MDKLLDRFNLNKEALNKFRQYYNYLIEENEKINLTSITDEKEAKEIGLRSQNWVSNNLTWNHKVNDFIKIYEEIIKWNTIIL